MRYLDAKTDPTLLKVFRLNPDLAVSFFNALLPFETAEEEIAQITEFVDPALTWRNNPLYLYNTLNMRCKDRKGRQFFVEMQMMWTSRYKHSVSFDSSKAYVRQLGEKANYKRQEPVYSLNIVSDTFSESKGYYHDFQIVEETETKEVIEGLRFIFIELPKFTPDSYKGKKMQVLWLRYLTEINEKTRQAPEELIENPEINKAITLLEESAFSKAQLLGYDRFWDMVSTAKTEISSSRREGREEGERIGMEKGKKIGMEEGEKKKAMEIAKKMKEEGVSIALIEKYSGLTSKEINAL